MLAFKQISNRMRRKSHVYLNLLLRKYKELALCSNSVRNSYTTYFETFPASVFATDDMGRFIYFNHSAERLSGYHGHDVLGRHFRLLFTLDDLNDGFLFFYQTMGGCYSEHSRFRIRCKDGSTKVIDVLATPVSFDSKVRGVLAIAEDVTGKASNKYLDRKRIVVFKKFMADLEYWDKKSRRVKEQIQKLLHRLSPQASQTSNAFHLPHQS